MKVNQKFTLSYMTLFAIGPNGGLKLITLCCRNYAMDHSTGVHTEPSVGIPEHLLNSDFFHCTILSLLRIIITFLYSIFFIQNFGKQDYASSLI